MFLLSRCRGGEARLAVPALPFDGVSAATPCIWALHPWRSAQSCAVALKAWELKAVSTFSPDHDPARPQSEAGMLRALMSQGNDLAQLTIWCSRVVQLLPEHHSRASGSPPHAILFMNQDRSQLAGRASEGKATGCSRGRPVPLLRYGNLHGRGEGGPTAAAA